MSIIDVIKNALSSYNQSNQARSNANPGVSPMAELAGAQSGKPMLNVGSNPVSNSILPLMALKMLGVAGNGQPRNPEVNSIYSKYSQQQPLSDQEKNLLNDQALQSAIGMVGQMSGGIKSKSPLDEQYLNMRRVIENMPEDELYRQVRIRKPTPEEFQKMTPEQRGNIADIIAKMAGTYKPVVKKVVDIYGGLVGH
jgi:hypothetical protein